MAPGTLEFEVRPSAFTYGGEALGRLPDGRAVFVPFAIPGERVLARVVEEKRGYVRAELVNILEPSPDRVIPRCIHFRVCGGCHYQHLPYRLQLDVKAAILRDQLERIGGIPAPPVEPTVPSPTEYNYRNNVQFHLTPDGKLGYQAAGSHAVIAIQECHLPEPPLNETWPLLDFESNPGLERVGLRLGAGEDILLSLEGADPVPPEMSIELPISAVYLNPGGTEVLAGDESLTMEVLGRPFRVSAGSFFQVNTALAEAMVNELLRSLPLSPATVLLDVYCGVGLFSAFMAPRVGRLIGVEISAAACDDFAANLDEFENVELYQGAAEEILPGLGARPDAVILDPPRAGVERRALDAVVGLAPASLAYISCDPSTLARDAKRLVTAGYRLTRSIPFDLFPQTFHIESVNFFEKIPVPE